MTATNTPTVDNGVDVAALLGAREAMNAMPQAAQFTWAATCEWIRGTHSRTTVKDYFGLGDDQSDRQEFTVDTDHPELFASADNGMTPPETVLVGLAGCLTASVATVATHRGITLDSIATTIEADMDLQGVLGVDPDVRNGFGAIAVRCHIDADATEAEIQALVAQAQKRSAVFDIVTNPTTVVVEAV